MATARFQRFSQKDNNQTGSLQMRWPAVRGETASAAVVISDPHAESINDRLFGSAKMDQLTQGYHLTAALEAANAKKEEKDGGGVQGRSSRATSRLTQEWLDEAKRLVGASTPARNSSPASLVGGSPCRFVASQSESSKLMERREINSRSARRHRVAEGVSDEILSRTARHNRTPSEWTLPDNRAAAYSSSAATSASSVSAHSDAGDAPSRSLPPRQPGRRSARFRDDSPDAQAPAHPRRSFRRSSPSPADPDNRLLSPPKNLVQSAHRRSISSNTCSQTNNSNPRGSFASSDSGKLSQSSRRSGSSDAGSDHRLDAGLPVDDDIRRINTFLRRQKAAIGRISDGESSAKARIIISGSPSTNTTSAMVAAICYAWLLGSSSSGGEVVVPMLNMKRARMCKHKEAAWLFHLLGIDASALLFADEVDVEALLISRRVNILFIGKDVLGTNGEVGSQCTVLTDNYCENAYDLLQTPNLKKLLLAGILLDTQNLDSASTPFTHKDAEAVQLLLVGSAPSYRHELFEQLMQDHRDDFFLEAMRRDYGKTCNDENEEKLSQKDRCSAKKSTSVYPQEVRLSSVNKKLISAPASALIPAPGKALETTKQKAIPASAPASAPAPVKVLETVSYARNKNKFLSKLFGFSLK